MGRASQSGKLASFIQQQMAQATPFWSCLSVRFFHTNFIVLIHMCEFWMWRAVAASWRQAKQTRVETLKWHCSQASRGEIMAPTLFFCFSVFKSRAGGDSQWVMAHAAVLWHPHPCTYFCVKTHIYIGTCTPIKRHAGNKLGLTIYNPSYSVVWGRKMASSRHAWTTWDFHKIKGCGCAQW